MKKRYWKQVYREIYMKKILVEWSTIRDLREAIWNNDLYRVEQILGKILGKEVNINYTHMYSNKIYVEIDGEKYIIEM